VHLIPRFFDASGGRLLIDDHDVREVTLDSLRSQIGIVDAGHRFVSTIRYETIIAYGQPHVSQKRVEEAARAARAHEFIRGLPEGYNTMIGERGVRLFGRRAAAYRDCARNSEKRPNSDSG